MISRLGSLGILLMFLIACENTLEQPTNSFNIKNAESVAFELVKDKSFYSEPKDLYNKGKIKIMSISGKLVASGSHGQWVVAAVDINADQDFDRYYSLQTQQNYQITEIIENGEIMFGGSWFIVNNTELDQIYLFSLGFEGKDSAAAIKKIPKSIYKRAKHHHMTGFGVGKASGNANGFSDIFNKSY